MPNDLNLQLLELLRCCLIGTKPPRAAEQYDLPGLLSLSRVHSVVGMAYMGMKQSGMFDENSLLPFKKAYDFFLQRFVLEHSNLDKIYAQLEQQKIVHVLLKGELMRELYPSPELRISYDVDVFVQLKDVKAAIGIIEQYGYATEHEGVKDILLVKDNSRFFELHHACFERQEDQQYYDDFLSLCEPCDGYGYRMRMRLEEVYIYHIMHLLKHFIYGNMDARHVLDCYLFFNKYPNVDREYIYSQLTQRGADGFAKGVEKLSRAWMGVEPFDEFCDYFTDFIIGKKFDDAQQRLILRETVIGRRTNMYLYYLHRVFLKTRLMKIRYPVLVKYPYLLPIMHIRRWFNFLLHNKENTKKEISSLSTIDRTQSENVRMLIEKMGVNRVVAAYNRNPQQSSKPKRM